jgi:hypothetical protein
LSNDIDRTRRLIIKSNQFLERALTRFTQSHADLDLVGPVASLEFSTESSVRRDCQINAAVPMGDFTLRRCARRASRGQHGDRF